MAWKSTRYISQPLPQHTSILNSGPSGTLLPQSLGTVVMMVVMVMMVMMVVVVMMVMEVLVVVMVMMVLMM